MSDMGSLSCDTMSNASFYIREDGMYNVHLYGITSVMKKEEIESAISPKKICDVEIIGKSKIGLITEDWYRLKPDAELKLHEVVMLLKLADMKFVANIVNSHMPTPLAEKFEKVGEIADLYADQQEAPNDTVKA